MQKGIQASGVSVRFVDDGTKQVIVGAGWARELYLHGGSRYTRLDAYSSAVEMIMSLKSGQYGTDAAASRRLIASLDELATKYPVRARIADVPSTPRDLVGELADGTQVLGIPVQVAPLPPEVLRHADDLGVRIAEVDVPVPTIVKEP